jgi:hypothetical protein
MSVAEPGSWDDLGSDEGGAYGSQTAGCQTWRRPRRSLERERPEEPPYRSECAIARLDLAPTIQELQATGCESLRAIAAGLEENAKLRLHCSKSTFSRTSWTGDDVAPLH